MVPDRQSDLNLDNESQDTGKNKWTAYLLLLGLSALSALVVLSPFVLLVLYAYANKESFAAYPPGGIILVPMYITAQTGQLLLVILATPVVISVYKGLSRRKQLYEISPFVRDGLPLLINILAATWFVIINLVWAGLMSGALRFR